MRTRGSPRNQETCEYYDIPATMHPFVPLRWFNGVNDNGSAIAPRTSMNLQKECDQFVILPKWWLFI